MARNWWMSTSVIVCLLASSCGSDAGTTGTQPIIPPPPPPAPPPPPPAAAPLTLAATPAGLTITTQIGTTATGAFVTLTIGGDSASTAVWTATARSARTSFASATGTGSGQLAWSRAVSGLGVGVWVDTITIRLAGGTPTAQVFDTVVITPVPLVLTLSPSSRFATITAGSTAPADSALISITGTGSGTLAWSAAGRRAWTQLVTTTGSGGGPLRWLRAGALPGVGTWVDTITVTADGASGAPARLLDTLVVVPAPPPPPPPTIQPDLGLNGSFNGMRLLPDADPWNQPVDTAQVDQSSLAILSAIGLTRGIHPDFGASYNGGPFGIPYIVVPDSTRRSSVNFLYASESDPGPYPIPANPPIEPSSDRHMLVVTRGEMKLYELFSVSGGPGTWAAGSGAIFDLINGTTRPAGWTSADAAGLPILPGLVRYDEVVQLGEVRHALRFTVSRTRRAYLPPARHWASSSTDPLRPPMGMRVRLKASYDISGFPPAAQVILRALKTYGMILADNGSDFFFSGTADARWNDTVINTLKAVTVGDFEVIRMSGVVTP